jgi:hypothetical protein
MLTMLIVNYINSTIHVIFRFKIVLKNTVLQLISYLCDLINA